MTENPAGNNENVRCTLEVVTAKDTVDAGAELELKCIVTCAEAAEMLAAPIDILDHEGQVVHRVELDRYDGELNETDIFAITAPREPGAYTWSAAIAGQETEGVEFERTTATFDLTVTPHSTRIEVWDVPSAVTAGEEFGIRVGVKCSAGCDQAAREFEVVDARGEKLAAGFVGTEPWPGTSALYFAEVVLRAPAEEGIFRWEARSAASNSGYAHEQGARVFGSNAVARPEHQVTVEVMDKDKQTPIKGMHILLHPFRARTDENGVAKLAVPSGEYSLLVSGFRYFPYRTPVIVSDDVSLTAEVEWEPIPEKISG